MYIGVGGLQVIEKKGKDSHETSVHGGVQRVLSCVAGTLRERTQKCRHASFFSKRAKTSRERRMCELRVRER